MSLIRIVLTDSLLIVGVADIGVSDIGVSDIGVSDRCFVMIVHSNKVNSRASQDHNKGIDSFFSPIFHSCSAHHQSIPHFPNFILWNAWVNNFSPIDEWFVDKLISNIHS